MHELICNEIAMAVKKEFGLVDPSISLLTGEGSDRFYYRIKSDDKTLILMIYGNEKAENDYFIHIQKFLMDLGVSVPVIHLKMPEKRWIFLEDLGNESLYTLYPRVNRQEKIALYKAVIDEASKIFFKGNDRYIKEPFVTAGDFDHRLYHWEHRYFIDNYLKLYKKIKIPLTRLEQNLADVAGRLAREENRLIHRDFQSKNIMVTNGKVYLIDFQGLRRGLPEYDLASLLCDPYVRMDEELINELLNYFFDAYSVFYGIEYELFRERFFMCSVQRLMQALGAYCFLGLVKNKSQFLNSIPAGEHILMKSVKKTSAFPELLKIMENR